jgi:hypothetical protein
MREPHHESPIRQRKNCPSHERRLPPDAQTTTAAPTGGPNPPKPTRIDSVHDAPIPERASNP